MLKLFISNQLVPGQRVGGFIYIKDPFKGLKAVIDVLQSLYPAIFMVL